MSGQTVGIIYPPPELRSEYYHWTGLKIVLFYYNFYCKTIFTKSGYETLIKAIVH